MLCRSHVTASFHLCMKWLVLSFPQLVFLHNKYYYLWLSFRARTWTCSTPARCWRRVMTFCSSGLLAWWWWASNWLASYPSKRWDEWKLPKLTHNTTGRDAWVISRKWWWWCFSVTGLSACGREGCPWEEDEQISGQCHWPSGRHCRDFPRGKT